VVWTYSGVRPLLDDQRHDASQVTRDYQLELETEGAPLLSVFGGKLTTYRKLAEQAVDKLAAQLGRQGPAWTARGAPLPGGEQRDFGALLAQVRASRPWLPAQMAWRLVRNYGTRAEQILGTASTLQDLGEHFGADLYRAEVDELCANEWVIDAQDLLWRRSKLGLRLTAGQQQRLAQVLGRAAPVASLAHAGR
jgi:glycerol-3-phosphate dehydrogenase